MSSMSQIKKDFLSAMKESGKEKTKPYDTSATVRRIEGKTAWVHIDGGVDETPVQLTIDAKAGDTVKVRVSGGQAWIVGNGTAPPTDDTKATEAEAKARSADFIAKLAKKTADQAGKTATNYLSWSTEYGLIVSEDATENVTEMTGGNTRINADGVEMYKGQTRVAKFGEESVVGDEDGAHVYLDPDTFNVTSSDRVQFFSVDMDGEVRSVIVSSRPVNTDVSDYSGYPYRWTSSLNNNPLNLETGDGFVIKFMIETANETGGAESVSDISFVKGTAKTSTVSMMGEDYDVAYDGDSTFAFEGWVSSAEYITWRYWQQTTKQVLTPAYTVGTRTGGTKGAFSVAIGEGITAEEENQIGLGKYNEGDSNNLLELGYGTDTNPKNVFAIDKSGNIAANNHPTMIECGLKTGATTSANTYQSFQITFTKTFTSTPIVTATLQATSSSVDFNKIQISVYNITTTGFYVRVYNGMSSQTAPNISWTAIEQ